MNKKILKLSLLIIIIISTLFILTGCGKDELKGTWGDGVDDFYNANWTFDGKGKVTMKSDFAEGTGNYSINGDIVTVELDIWENKKEYKFIIENNKLTLEATDEISPSYKELTKK